LQRGRKGEEFAEKEGGGKVITKERRAIYGMVMELHCADKVMVADSIHLSLFLTFLVSSGIYICSIHNLWLQGM